MAGCLNYVNVSSIYLLTFTLVVSTLTLFQEQTLEADILPKIFRIKFGKNHHQNICNRIVQFQVFVLVEV